MVFFYLAFVGEWVAVADHEELRITVYDSRWGDGAVPKVLTDESGEPIDSLRVGVAFVLNGDAYQNSNVLSIQEVLDARGKKSIVVWVKS